MASMVFGDERDFASIWQGVKASEQEDEKQTLSFLATAISNEKALALVAHNCDLKSLHDFRGRNIVHFAAMQTNSEIVRILLENGAPPESARSPENSYALHHAVKFNDNPEITRLLLQHGAAADKFVYGRSLLHLAVEIKSIDKVRILW
jgi:ankyrin repeat protein